MNKAALADKKVLLIDDEKDILIIMGERISSWGYCLIAATNGKDAVDIILKSKPDIIVLDYHMPRMDGVQTLKKIREIDKEIPVIMFTAYPDEKSIEGTEGLGVSAYIPKFSMYSYASSSLKAALNMFLKASEG